MKKFFERQKATDPDFAKLDAMLSSLNKLLDTDADNKNKYWSDSVRELIAFQDENGSFNLLDSFQIDHDSRFEMCVYPHHMATAVLIRALLESPESGEDHLIPALRKALSVAEKLGLVSHGYDSQEGTLRCVNAYFRGEIKEFLRRYPDLCPEFTDMIKNAIEYIVRQHQEEKYYGDWGIDYREKIVEIANAAMMDYVFVYGTLMKGQPNHEHFLPNENEPISATVAGYVMYDLGSFPGIIRGNGLVRGELYRINGQTLKLLDGLEGEGRLYARKPIQAVIADGKRIRALAYIWLGHTDCFPVVPESSQPWDSRTHRRNGYFGNPDEELIWYVSYGSNMLKERFDCYLQGGVCRFNGRTYSGCRNQVPALRSQPVELPYNMYYGNYDRGSWRESAVSFLDVSCSGKSFGRAWLIHRDQLEDIHAAEGMSRNWYPDLIELEPIDGIRAFTFSNKNKRTQESLSRVSSEYLGVLTMGLRETYPDMKEADLIEYLRKCGRE